MKIWIDTREKPQAIKNIIAYFDRHGIEWERIALKTGDYMLDGNPLLTVDRKQSLDEVATNLMNRNDKARFWREVRRAREQGIRLIVLCEHGHGIQSIQDVKNWHSEYSRVTGKALMDEIFRVHISYNVDFIFTDKRHTAKRILELLTGKENDKP